MGGMNVCENDNMNASETFSIARNPMHQQNFPSDQYYPSCNQMNQLTLPLEQQNFNIDNSYSNENELEHERSEYVAQACFACSTLFGTSMPCLQLFENCQF